MQGQGSEHTDILGMLLDPQSSGDDLENDVFFVAGNPETGDQKLQDQQRASNMQSFGQSSLPATSPSLPVSQTRPQSPIRTVHPPRKQVPQVDTIPNPRPVIPPWGGNSGSNTGIPSEELNYDAPQSKANTWWGQS